MIAAIEWGASSPAGCLAVGPRFEFSGEPERAAEAAEVAAVGRHRIRGRV